MVQSLLVVLVVKVSLPELSVCSDQYEKIFSMDVHKNLADRQLLDSYLDLPVQVLLHEELIELVFLFNFKENKKLANKIKFKLDLLRSPQIFISIYSKSS